MLPGFVRNNRTHIRMRYIVPLSDSGDIHTFPVQATDFKHIRFGQFCLRSALTTRLASLFYFVGCIVGMSAKPKMLGVDTGRIVSAWAVVAYTQTIGDNSIVNLVTKTVSQVVSIIKAHLSVFIAGPRWIYPALLSGTYCKLRPKDIVKRCTRLDSPIMPNNKSNGLTNDMTLFRIASFCNRRGFAAPALAYTGWIRANALRAFVVPKAVQARLIAVHRCLFAASTKAVTKGNRGIIGVHKKSPFLCLIRERLVIVARYFYWSFYHSIIPHLQGLVE